MRLTSLLPLAGVAAAGIAGWFVGVAAIPTWSTDLIWRAMLKHGARVNVLREAHVRSAPGDIVPLDNADTITRAVIYDLAKGPLLFEADVPSGLEYWSVSIFARNTDTLLVANDRATGPGRFRLIVRAPDQHSRQPANMQVVSPSTRGFLLVRAVMKDRNDSRDVARTLAAVAPERVATVPDDR